MDMTKLTATKRSKISETGEEEADSSPASKSLKTTGSFDRTKDALQKDNAIDQMKKIWNHLKADSEIINAYKMTTYLANQQVEQLMEVGLEAFSRWEEASRDLKDLHEELQSKDIELKRLEASEENNRANITNLLQAVEKSQSDNREASQVALIEAKARSELAAMTSKYNNAISQMDEAKRKALLLEEEVKLIKVKLSATQQENIKMERDKRAVTSMVMNLNSSTNINGSATGSDIEYYKRKATEMSRQVQALNAVVAEKNRERDALRRQLERNMSQNRLAKHREVGKQNRKK